jgi:putative DNA primase/helicase
VTIDQSKLEKVKHKDGGIVTARCPVCAEQGHDKTGNHLSIFPNGRFGCVQFPRDEGKEHRKRIFALVGVPDEKARAYSTIEEAIASQERQLKMKATRRDPYNSKFVVVRFDAKEGDKQFRPFHLSNDGWVVKDPPGKLPLFNLTQLRERPQEEVVLVEGEKCVCEFRERTGLLVTTSSHGAKAADKSDWSPLAGRKVVILPDNDSDGTLYAEKASGILLGLQATVKTIKLPAMPPKGDCVAWLQGRNGQSREDIAREFQDLVTGATARVPLTADDIRGEIIAIWTDDNLSRAEQRTRIAKAVVQALARRGKFFYHAERRDFESAMFFDNERKRLERIRSDSFLAWVSDWLRVNRADVLFRYISSEIETAALTESISTGIISEAFWAARPGAIYLSNGDAAVAKITPSNVQLVDNGTDGVLFSAGDMLKPWELTEPRDPFETCSLFKKANCAAAHGSDLLRAWILSLSTNPACKPPLCLAGDVGSGKTRLAKGVAELYGIPFTANNVDDFGDENFWVSVDGGGLFTLDNCDTRNKWLADSVAAAATDGCRDRRKLYTDLDRVKLRARAWICLTTANPTFAGDAGLGDRLLVVRMNRRTDETLDSLLSDEIKQHRNSGLSFIARTLASALADDQPVPTGLNKRHPDFAVFAVRIGRAIGREQQAIDALRIAEKDKSLFCLENDYIAAALLDFLAENESFTGTAKELRGKLVEFDPGFINDQGKPSAKSIGRRLGTVWPHLENMLKVAKQEKDNHRVMTYAFESGKTVDSDELDEFKSPFQQNLPYARI